MLDVERGAWEPPPARPGPLGLLVLEGLLERDVVLAGIGCTDLLGRGDLLHPWRHEEGEPSFPFEVRWAALERTRLAFLDARFATAVAPWPDVAARLSGRAARVTDSLAVHFAITCLVGLESRLWVLFWHLADRFGHVEPAGAVVPIDLTHESLGRLVRARRPSVTASLGRLREHGLVVRRSDGTWLLRGDPPGELERLRRGDVREER